MFTITTYERAGPKKSLTILYSYVRHTWRYGAVITNPTTEPSLLSRSLFA